MGYYTQLAMDVGIKEDKIEQFKKAIKRQLARVKADPEYWFAYYADISVDEYGTILFEDYYRKIYDVEKFAKWLAKFVEKGYIYGYGEEAEDVWRICFDGKGNFEIQEARFVWDTVKA